MGLDAASFILMIASNVHGPSARVLARKARWARGNQSILSTATVSRENSPKVHGGFCFGRDARYAAGRPPGICGQMNQPLLWSVKGRVPPLPLDGLTASWPAALAKATASATFLLRSAEQGWLRTTGDSQRDTPLDQCSCDLHVLAPHAQERGFARITCA